MFRTLTIVAGALLVAATPSAAAPVTVDARLSQSQFFNEMTAAPTFASASVASARRAPGRAHHSTLQL